MFTFQAVDRYYATENISAKLALKTKDGALLNPDDVIKDVIENNEEVIGEICGLQFPPLLQRYDEHCREFSTGMFYHPLVYCCSFEMNPSLNVGYLEYGFLSVVILKS